MKKTEIASPVIEALKAEGSAVFRTDYNLNDEEFMEIAKQVITQYESDKLSGSYWMG